MLKQKAFRVRGWTTFRRKFKKTNDWKLVIPSALEILRKRAKWNYYYVDGGDPQRDNFFSPRQIVDSMSPKKKQAQSFEKAMITLLCAEIAGGAVDASVDVYEFMNIEPACFYVGGFSEAVFESIKQVDPKIVANLCAHCGQPEPDVFTEMAKGHTVTECLAVNAREVLAAAAPAGVVLGPVSGALNPGLAPYKVSKLEYLDAPISVNGGGTGPAINRNDARAA